MTVLSQRIYSWAFETAISGAVSAQTITEAAGQFHHAGGGRVWLLDAGRATSFDLSALGSISENVAALRADGLDRVALVLPEQARAFASFINVEPVVVYPFETRDQAIAWIQRGCPA